MFSLLSNINLLSQRVSLHFDFCSETDGSPGLPFGLFWNCFLRYLAMSLFFLFVGKNKAYFRLLLIKSMQKISKCFFIHLENWFLCKKISVKNIFEYLCILEQLWPKLALFLFLDLATLRFIYILKVFSGLLTKKKMMLSAFSMYE